MTFRHEISIFNEDFFSLTSYLENAFTSKLLHKIKMHN